LNGLAALGRHFDEHDDAWPARCATIFPSENIELDLENRGNPLLAHIEVTRMLRIVGTATSALLLTAVLAGIVALKAEYSCPA
jgi:hypothetical protein